jgi:pyocin large subunit-like protein
MMFAVNRLESVQRNVCVNLGGRDISMAENRLHRAQVRAIANHVRRATVAQHMWADRALGRSPGSAHDLPNALSGELAPARRHEY